MVYFKKLVFMAFIILFNFSTYTLYCTKKTHFEAEYQWVIVGAGPAGIITIGLLLDLGTDPQSILWIDPEFNVGRMGKYYSNVPGNAKTKDWIEFINNCKTFQKCPSAAIAKLYEYDPHREYELKIIVEPLIDISEYLCKKINCKKSVLKSLNFENNIWRVGTDNQNNSAAHVVLATGSHPRSLHYDKQEIPLDSALDKPTLANNVTPDDTIGVIGSAQSAILLLKYLSELPVARVINFYKHHIDLTHPENGLLGMTAEWAKNVLAVTPPGNLIRVYNCPETIQAWLPICSKVIYAVGFERNELPPIGNAAINFDDKNGIIGPRLFGIGIAFPEKITDASGNQFSRIGLTSFMEYAQRIIPEWMATKISITRYEAFEDLFTIDML